MVLKQIFDIEHVNKDVINPATSVNSLHVKEEADLIRRKSCS